MAVASTLSPTVRELDAGTGEEQFRMAAAGPALRSPVMANGRLFVGSYTVVEGFVSDLAPPPEAPELAGVSPDEATSSAVTLSWSPGGAIGSGGITYQARIDVDGD